MLSSYTPKELNSTEMQQTCYKPFHGTSHLQTLPGTPTSPHCGCRIPLFPSTHPNTSWYNTYKWWNVEEETHQTISNRVTGFTNFTLIRQRDMRGSHAWQLCDDRPLQQHKRCHKSEKFILGEFVKNLSSRIKHLCIGFVENLVEFTSAAKDISGLFEGLY